MKSSFIKSRKTAITPESGSRKPGYKQLGQSMTEYIIIVALIAVAAIGVVSAFGGVVQNQFAAMSLALSGNAAAPSLTAATASSAAAVGAAGDKKLSNYAQ